MASDKHSSNNVSFFRPAISPGVVILCCVVASLVVANTPLATAFDRFMQQPVGCNYAGLHLLYPVQSWINDGAMAVFFLLVGLEIKRELVEGELSTPRQALLPVICAIGGAITPALIYAYFNRGEITAPGWGIPMATDIAFALAVIGTLAKRIPSSLRVFLTALAIVDDLVAILVIALFYSGELHYQYLIYAGLVVVFMFILNRLTVTRLFCYIIPGIALWYFIHHSGIHATVAGITTAALIPLKTRKGSPLKKLEHMLELPVNYFVVPLFALANTNISFGYGMLQGLVTPLGLGIVAGLVLGKLAGIFLSSLLMVKGGLCRLPDNVHWRHMFGVSLLAGIGFTMSIFLAVLSFPGDDLLGHAKFAVITASLLSTFLGYLVLRYTQVSR